MTAINWNDFYFMLPYCLFGFLIHLVSKLVIASKIPDFSFKSFVKRQWLGWVLAWLLCTLCCYLTIRKVQIVQVSDLLDVTALFIGTTAGSAGKNLVKIFSKRETKL